MPSSIQPTAPTQSPSITPSAKPSTSTPSSIAPTFSPTTALPTSANVLFTGLQLYYPFSNGTVSGSLVADIAAGSPVFTGQLYNGATVSNGQLLLSSGQSQFFSVSLFSTGTTGLSFACWFRSSNSGNQARIFDFGNGSPSDNIIMYINSNSFEVSLFVGSQATNLNTGVNVNNNVWAHAVWTISPSGNWTVYLDGSIVAAQSGLTYPTAISRLSNNLGRSNWGSDPYFNGACATSGSITEFSLWGRWLSFTRPHK